MAHQWNCSFPLEAIRSLYWMISRQNRSINPAGILIASLREASGAKPLMLAFKPATKAAAVLSGRPVSFTARHPGSVTWTSPFKKIWRFSYLILTVLQFCESEYVFLFLIPHELWFNVINRQEKGSAAKLSEADEYFVCLYSGGVWVNTTFCGSSCAPLH